jgi:hypothetical protein
VKVDESGPASGPGASPNGYYGAAYWNSQTHEIVVANRGSRLSGAGWNEDWTGSDKFIAAQGALGVPPAFQESEQFAEQVRDKFPNVPVSYTGHSLGGAEAQFQAANSGGSAVTFGAPGAAFAVKSTNGAKVTNYVLPGDIVGMRGNHVGAAPYITPSLATLGKDVVSLGIAGLAGPLLGPLIAAAGLAYSNHPLANYAAALKSADDDSSSPSGGGGPLQVINATNLIVCTGCPVPLPLTVTSQPNVECQSQLCATIADCIPIVNVPIFGPCLFTPAPPSPSGGPCIPKPVGPWSPGSPTTTYDGIPALRETDTLQCAMGGRISVIFPGQVIFEVE